MAKKDQMLRLMSIVNYLKSKPKGASYEDISRYLEQKHYEFYKEKEDDFKDFAFSEKTFQRDRNILANLLSIKIQFKRSSMTYQIEDLETVDSTQSIFDNLLLVNAYKQTADRSDIMLFEKRQASGLQHLEGLIHAIKNQKVVSLQYTKYWEGVPKRRVLEPYALKEFRNRWYLIANEDNRGGFVLKTFGLDRISDLEIHSKSFTKKAVDIEELFINSFGIISTIDETPIKIKLSFEPWQGMFVKSLPIHHSQKILLDTDEELKIEICLVPTYDFYQELLTHAERITKIEPASVRKEYLKFLEKGISAISKN